MSNDPKQLNYSHLTIPERILLAQELWESVYDHATEIPLTDAEQQEIERRWAAYETGAMTASPWSEVKQRLLEK
jgi:putative addiction module component (TIGR02574 family)